MAVIVISAGVSGGGTDGGRQGGLRDVEPHLCLAPTTVTQRYLISYGRRTKRSLSSTSLLLNAYVSLVLHAKLQLKFPVFQGNYVKKAIRSK